MHQAFAFDLTSAVSDAFATLVDWLISSLDYS